MLFCFQHFFFSNSDIIVTNHNSFMVYNLKVILECFEYCETLVLKIMRRSILKLIGMSKTKALILSPFFGPMLLLSELFPQTKRIYEIVH